MHKPSSPPGVPQALSSVGRNDQSIIQEANPDLKQFLDAKNLLHSATISDLKELLQVPEDQDRFRLAVDGNNVLSTLMKAVNLQDPLWFLLGPYPSLLLQLLEELVEQMRRSGIVPLFIFSGMAVHGDVESFVNTQEEMVERDALWFYVQQGQQVTNEQIDRAFDVFLSEDVEMMIMRYLQDELHVETFRAPFLQWGQMVAFTLPQIGYCSGMWGPPEILLLEGVERVIVDIDFMNGAVVYCDKSEILKNFFPNLSEKDRKAMFLDLSLLTATHQSLILLRPPLDNGTLPYMLQVLRRIAQDNDKVSDMVCSSFPDKKVANSQTWKFLKGRCYVRHCMVLIPGLKDHAGLVPLSKLLEDQVPVPKNLTGVLGSRLPPMMYYFQFIGLLSVSTMTTVSQNYIRDDNPVSDSVQYRQCMETVISLRTQVLYQLVQFLQTNEEYFHRVKVSWIRWYEPITAPVRRPPEIRLAHWRLDDVASNGDLSKVSFQSVIEYATRGTNSTDVKYTNVNQVLHAVFLKSLDLLGYFTHANVEEQQGDPANAEVSGMSCYSETIRCAVTQPHFVEQCVLLIELLRTKSLSLTKFVWITAENFLNSNYEGIPEFSGHDAIVPLASRISSLLDLPIKPGKWGSGYDRDLMTFSVLVRNMHRTLRTTTEVIATSMYLDDSAEISISDYSILPKYLPFGSPPSTVAGLITQFILEQPIEGTTPMERVTFMERVFPQVEDMQGSLKTLFDFWEDAYYVLSELHNKDTHTVDETLLNVMTMAVTQMRDRREGFFGETPQPSFEQQGQHYHQGGYGDESQY